MDTVLLRADLIERLKQDAEQEDRSVDDLVNEAIERYLLDRQRAKLDREIAAYEALRPELLRSHPGEWVAIHDQRLIDHDPDGSSLYQRIRSRYGQAAVLVRRVTEQPNDELRLRTPSTGNVGA